MPTCPRPPAPAARLRLPARAVPADSSRTRWRMARELGASDAGAEVSEGAGLSVSVRKGEIENVERNRDKSLGVTRLRRPAARQCQHARTSRAPRSSRRCARPTTSPASPPRTRPPACPTPHDLATPARGGARPRPVPPLGHRRRARRPSWRCAARPRRSPPTGASPTPKAPACRRSSRTSSPATRAAFAAAMPARATRCRSRRSPARRAATTCSATPGTARCATPRELAAPEAVGRYAAERALSRLKSRKIATCEVPVLFESPLASGLLGAYVQATSGGALYRKASFLLDSLGKRGAARAHRHATRTRTSRAARAARRSTTKACARGARKVVDAGVVQGYFLSSYSARKLGMQHHRPCRRLAEPDADAAASRSRATTSTRCCASWAAACSSSS